MVVHIFLRCVLFFVASIIAITLKILTQKQLLVISNEFLLFSLVGIIPLSFLIKYIANAGGQRIFSSFLDLMDTHIFSISTGDIKEQEKIEKNSKLGKEIVIFTLNAVFSIVLSIVFFVID